MTLYRSCDEHNYPRASCVSCHAAANSATLAMVRRLRASVPNADEQDRLDAFRHRWQHGPADLPDPRDVVTDAVDPDGMVVRVRSIGAEEWLAMVERRMDDDAA